jgi:spore germination protein GerM
MKAHYDHSIRQRTIVGISLLLLSVTGGSVWWIWIALKPTAINQQAVLTKTEPTKADTFPVASQSQQALAQSQAAIPAPKPPTLNRPQVLNRQVAARQPESYWLQMDGQHISLIPQRVTRSADSSSEQVLIAGVDDLLANSPTANQSSAIPPGTRLLSLQIAPEGIYVDLSREFSQGGGSDSMIYRVAQVLYTVTSLDPNAKVYLSVEGQRLDENHPLGGEGLLLKQPLTRQQFTEDFSLG